MRAMRPRLLDRLAGRSLLAAAAATLVAAAVLATGGCGTVISGAVPPAEAPTPSGTVRVGAARVDITPPPGYPMGGHSIDGAVARGHWTRLYARTVYFEDASGRALALVSADLWSVPAGLADRAAEIVRKSPSTAHLGREHVVVAATHTHHGPGGFSSCRLYNENASRLAGFDPDLFEFLATRIAESIRRAADARTEAVVRVPPAARVGGFWRNRSFEAFLRNPESLEVLEANAWIEAKDASPEYPDPRAWRGVDPRVRALVASRPDGSLIAVAAFAALHPTAIRADTEAYHGDLAGVATSLAERRLGALGGRDVVVAFFNGAEGDVSPRWIRQDRGDAVAVGNRLAAEIEKLATSAASSPPAKVELSTAFDVVPLAGRAFVDDAGREVRTAPAPMSGFAQLGGAEDGRTLFHRLGWIEGVRGVRSPGYAVDGHGAKQPALDLPVDPWPLPWFVRLLIPRTTSFVRAADLPQFAPLSVHRLGDVVLASLPGEFTATLGRRIERGIARAAAVDADRVYLLGLAHEYVSYFATPEEFDAQHYEGASTLWGAQAGPFIGHELARLAGTLDVARAPSPHDFSYQAGSSRRFGPAFLGEPPARRVDGVAAIVVDDSGGDPRSDFPAAEWWDGAPATMDFVADDRSTSPHVTVEVRAADGSWAPAADDSGTEIVTLLVEVLDGRGRWTAIWLRRPPSRDAHAVRFRVVRLDGSTIHVDPSTTP
jgi:neutral ceramidase